MTSHDTDLASAENEEVTLGSNNKDRPPLDLPARLLQRCEVHEYIFCVITSGVICVLCSPSDSHSDDMHMQLLHQHMLHCSMHNSAHAALLHVHFTTCNCSMHFQHLHVLAQARPTMFCIPLVICMCEVY